MALRCVAEDDTGDIFDGVLAIDPNLEKGTCVLTGMFSKLDPQSPNDVIKIFREVADKCETVEDWISTHGYVINCVDKISSDLSVLVRQCTDISAPFFTLEEGEPSPFVQWFRKASENAEKVRCRFADDPMKRGMIAEMRMQHLDNQCLGDGFNDNAFAFIPEANHLDLMKVEVFRNYMDDFMDSFAS